MTLLVFCEYCVDGAKVFPEGCPECGHRPKERIDLGDVDLADIFGTTAPYTLRDFLNQRLATPAMADAVLGALRKARQP